MEIPGKPLPKCYGLLRSKNLFDVLKTALALMLISSTAAAAQEVGSSGRISGTVVDQATRQPLSGVILEVLGSDRGALTGIQGEFVLDRVPLGMHTLRVQALGYATRHMSEVAVTAGQTVQLHVELESTVLAMEGVVVRSYFAKPAGVVGSTYSMSPDEIRRAPGAMGDVARLVQTLPGVVPTSDQRNDLVVRGGSPYENLTLLDNVEVPNLSHFNVQGGSGGPISMLNTDLLLGAEFLAGGYPARYGNRLSSVLNLSLREGNRERKAAGLDVGLAGASGILEGPLGPKGSWIVSGRRSFLDLIIGSVGFTAVPKYSSYQLKLTQDPNPRNKLWFVGLGGTDAIHFAVNEQDTSDPSTLDIRSGGWRTINGLNWQSLLGTRGYGVLGISDVYTTYRQEAHDARLGGQRVYGNDSRERESTLKYDVSYQLTGAAQVGLGLSTKWFGSWYEIDQPLGAQNPYSAQAQRTAPVSVSDDSSEFLHAGYLQLARNLSHAMSFTGGMRYSYFGQSGTSRLDPRAGVQYHIRTNLTWSASAGRFHQNVPLIFTRADPRNADLEPIRADHLVSGLTFYPLPDLRVSAEAYIKRYSDYPVSLERPTLSMANMGDSFSISGLMMPYVSEGTGRSEGLDLHVQKKLTGSTYGQVAYSRSRARHAAGDRVLRRSSFDMPHVLSVTGGYRPGRTWEVSGKFTFASGRAYTPLLRRESFEQNRPILDLDRVNDERSPAYHRLDLHAERRLDFRRASVVGFVDVQNVYNRKNTFQYAWNPKTREQVSVNQISFLPVAGLTVRF